MEKSACPVCHTPRNLREQVLDEAIAKVRLMAEEIYEAEGHTMFYTSTIIEALSSLKDKPNHPTA